MEVNQLVVTNCVEFMEKMDENSVDLTVTSPPYDNLRDYKGYSFDFEGIAKGLYRVTKEGGVVVWVVGDRTHKGNRSLTSFRQALYFQELGFNAHDIMIYRKKKYTIYAFKCLYKLLRIYACIHQRKAKYIQSPY